MIDEIKSRLEASLRSDDLEADIHTPFLKDHNIEKMCDVILDEIEERGLIKSGGKYKCPIGIYRPLSAAENLKKAIATGLSSFEEQTDVPVASKLVAYNELVSHILRVLSAETNIHSSH